MQIITAPTRDEAIAYALTRANQGLDVFTAARCASAIKVREIPTPGEFQQNGFDLWRVSIAIIEDGREVSRQRWEIWNEPDGIYGEW